MKFREMRILRHIMSIDRIALFSILLSVLSLSASIVLPWYFEQRALENTSLRVDQLRSDIYALGQSGLQKTDVEKETKSLTSQPVPEAFGITINGKAYDYAIISYWSIRNSGRRPIHKNDFVRPIMAELSPGAKFLYVKTVETSSGVKPGEWLQDKSGMKTSYTPELLNPGDAVVVCFAVEYLPDKPESRNIHWSTRVSGLNNLMVETFESRRGRTLGPFDVVVLFEGIEIYVLVLFVAVILTLVLILASHRNRIPKLAPKNIALIVILTLISMSTSEIISHWIFREAPLAWHVCAPLLFAFTLIVLMIAFMPVKSLNITDESLVDLPEKL